MSKLANEIFDILKLCWSFSVAEKQYLKWVIITREILGIQNEYRDFSSL